MAKVGPNVIERVNVQLACNVLYSTTTPRHSVLMTTDGAKCVGTATMLATTNRSRCQHFSQNVCPGPEVWSKP